MCFTHASSPLTLRGEDAAGTAEDERLAGVALVEEEGAGGGRDAALVAAVDDPAMHPVEHDARVQQPFGKLVGRRLRIAEAEDVGVEDRTRALAGAEDVAVHADDTGDRAAVGVERRGAVVRLGLEAEQRFVVEGDHAGVVVEDALHEGGVGDALGGRLDVRPEE